MLKNINYFSIGVMILLTSCIVSKDKYLATKQELKITKDKMDSVEYVNRKLTNKTERYDQIKESKQNCRQKVDTLNHRLESIRKEYEDMAQTLKRLRTKNKYLKNKNRVVKDRLARVVDIVTEPIDSTRRDSRQ